MDPPFHPEAQPLPAPRKAGHDRPEGYAERVAHLDVAHVLQRHQQLDLAQGRVKARQEGGAGNIPWLWLTATSTGKPGRFADVTSVLRVATQGGVEPTEGCDTGHVGEEAKVPYTADYCFYKRG